MQNKSSRDELNEILFKAKQEDHTVRNTLLAGGTVAGLGTAAYLAHAAGNSMKSYSESASGLLDERIKPTIAEIRSAAKNVKDATAYTRDLGRLYQGVKENVAIMARPKTFGKLMKRGFKRGLEDSAKGGPKKASAFMTVGRKLGKLSKRIGLSAKEELNTILFASDADEQRKMARQAMLRYSLQKSVDNSGNAMTLPGIIGGGIVGSGIAASRGKNALIGAAIGAPVGMLAMRAAGRIDERRRLHRLGNDLQQSIIAKRDTQLSAREELDTILFEGGYSGYTTVTDDEGRNHLVPQKERGVIAHLKRNAATYAGIPLAPIGVIGGMAIDHYRYRSNMGRIAARTGKTLPETF